MTRWARLLLALFFGKRKPPLKPGDVSVYPFRVWFTDVDAKIMNHACMMTILEAGRIDLMVRTGFFALARKNGWYFPSSAISVQFLRPMKTFEKGIVHTSLLHANDTYIYLEQKIIRDEQPVAVCVVKSTIRKGRAQVPILAVLEQLGGSMLPADGKKMVDLLEAEGALLRERYGV